MRHPTRFQQKTLWSAATGIAILILGGLFVGLVWLVGQIFGFLQPVLVPLIVAGIIAYLLDPVVRILENRGLSRLWAVVTVFFATLVAITLLVAAVLPAIQGGRNFFREVFAKPVVAESAGAIAEASGQDVTEDKAATEPEPDLAPALVRVCPPPQIFPAPSTGQGLPPPP